LYSLLFSRSLLLEWNVQHCSLYLSLRTFFDAFRLSTSDFNQSIFSGITYVPCQRELAQSLATDLESLPTDSATRRSKLIFENKSELVLFRSTSPVSAGMRIRVLQIAQPACSVSAMQMTYVVIRIYCIQKENYDKMFNINQRYLVLLNVNCSPLGISTFQCQGVADT